MESSISTFPMARMVKTKLLLGMLEPRYAYTHETRTYIYIGMQTPIYANNGYKHRGPHITHTNT